MKNKKKYKHVVRVHFDEKSLEIYESLKESLNMSGSAVIRHLLDTSDLIDLDRVEDLNKTIYGKSVKTVMHSFDAESYKELLKQADTNGLGLSAYIRGLIKGTDFMAE